MLSFTGQQTLFGDLSQNNSAANLARGATLANIEQRYLLQKFFANETSYSITTVGALSLTATGAISLGATSATLTVAWAYNTTTTWATFSDGEYRRVNFTAGSTAITWSGALTAAVTSAITVGGVQYYPFPPNYSKLKTITLTIGALTWTLDPIHTREEWDKLNVFPYYADIPKNYFIYPGGDHGGQIGIWPIPSTTGNLITYNYKFRVPDLSLADYSTGSVSVGNGATAVTGAGTSWTPTTNAQLESRWIQISQTAGDNLWYQVQSVNSATSITLYQPYQGITVSGGSYTLGQMPLIAEDFQDLLVWSPLRQYFATIKSDKTKYEEFRALYEEKSALLKEYSGSNSIEVNLSPKRNRRNPNNFPYALTG